MPFTATHLTSGGSNTDGLAYTTASVTVQAGDLLIVFVSSGTAVATTALPTSITGTLGSTLTWTNRGDVIMNSSSVARTSVWTAKVTTGASGTITFNWQTINQSNAQWHVSRITGADNDNPVVQVDTLRTAATNPSMTISPAPAADSMVIGAMHANIATAPTAGTGWTLHGTVPAFSGASPALGQSVELDLTSPSATFAFTLNSATNKGLIAVEIRPAPTAKTGSASGTISWVGTATGARASAGAATGAVSFVGQATGTTVRKGAASGSVAWVGSATGVRVPKGSATGAVSWVGSATGTAPASTSKSGSASGAVSWVGSATGARRSAGAATGALSWVGTAAGARASAGSATGSLLWTGVASGARASLGAASGLISWVGAAFGLDSNYTPSPDRTLVVGPGDRVTTVRPERQTTVSAHTRTTIVRRRT